VELLLLQDDLGVAAQVGEMAATLDRGLGHGTVVVVGDGAHDRCVTLKGGMHVRRVGDVQPHRVQPTSPISGEKLGQLFGPEVGQSNLGDSRILKEIVSAGASLEPGTEDQQLHS
jgi:hypothetical protein